MRASKRQLIWLFAVFFLMVTTASAAWAEGESEEVMETPLDLDELVRPSVVYAEITVETPAYDDWATGRSKVGQFSAGEVVEVVRDRGYEWYFVRAADGREGWVSVNSLAIPSDPATNTNRLPKEMVEAFVNTRGLTSKTDQLVWVDIDRQLTHVFVGSAGSWQLVRTMNCATGKNTAPTLRGFHEIGERGEWFFAERFSQGAENWVQFSGPYLFHSLPMDREHNIVDYKLGVRSSSGCVRLSMEDSLWFYSFIKRNSAVFVY